MEPRDLVQSQGGREDNSPVWVWGTHSLQMEDLEKEGVSTKN